ncbi:MAG: hypothetical protein WAM79_15180 [Candidatus Sulfotelmatobacter sp.]
MKCLNYVAIVGTVAMLSPLALFAATKTARNVNIGDPVVVGTTHLKPGNYKVEWEGTGPAVQVNFLHDGKIVATAPATLHTEDAQVTQNDVITDKTSTNGERLKEIDFQHQKEALVFSLDNEMASPQKG